MRLVEPLLRPKMWEMTFRCLGVSRLVGRVQDAWCSQVMLLLRVKCDEWGDGEGVVMFGFSF